MSDTCTIGRCLVVGPLGRGPSGGQVTHMENIKRLFADCREVRYFHTTVRRVKVSGYVTKFFRALGVCIIFPFFLIGRDVIHLNSSFHKKVLVRDWFLCMWCRLLGKRMIIQYHGGDHQLAEGLAARFYRGFWRKATVLVLTTDQLEIFRRQSGVKVSQIKNYIALPDVPPVHRDSAVVRFIYLGRIREAKGLEEISRAAAMLRDERFTIDIYGSGEFEKTLRELLDKNGISDRVVLRGSVQGAEKDSVYRGADVFLYPSYREGFPYAVLEALSYGLPVICTDVGALKEALTDDQTCLKVEIASAESLAAAMKRLLHDPALRSRLACAGRELVEAEYALSKLKKRLIDIWGAA